ncbi:MAG: protein TonB, partial [Maricaulis maris]
MVLPIAGAVTIGLFLMMKDLIAVPGVERVAVEEPPSYAINVEVVPIDPEVRTSITENPPVEPPPPVQRLTVERAVPSGPAHGVSYELPPVDPPVV